MKRLVAMGLLLCAGLASANDPLVFSASAKVSISATGAVTGVEPDGSLSPALQQLVRDEVSRYRFEPPTLAGKRVDGTTYVSLGGCAVPNGEEFRVSLAYKGVGPQLVGGRLIPPSYPASAYQAGAEADAIVYYLIGTDGRAMVESIEYEDHSKLRGREKVFDRTLREWIAGLRYRPEALAGAPVRTRYRVPVSFELSGSPPSRREVRKEWLERNECVAASGAAELTPVAINPAFKRLPSG